MEIMDWSIPFSEAYGGIKGNTTSVVEKGFIYYLSLGILPLNNDKMSCEIFVLFVYYCRIFLCLSSTPFHYLGFAVKPCWIGFVVWISIQINEKFHFTNFRIQTTAQTLDRLRKHRLIISDRYVSIWIRIMMKWNIQQSLVWKWNF